MERFSRRSYVNIIILGIAVALTFYVASMFDPRSSRYASSTYDEEEEFRAALSRHALERLALDPAADFNKPDEVFEKVEVKRLINGEEVTHHVGDLESQDKDDVDPADEHDGAPVELKTGMPKASLSSSSSSTFAGWGWEQRERNDCEKDPRWCDSADKALEAVRAHQFPSDCRTANLLIMTDQASGLGSMIHVRATMLGYAMSIGRVLVFRQGGPGERGFYRYIAQEDCPQQNFDCFFKPATNCLRDTWGKRKRIYKPKVHELENYSATLHAKRVIEVSGWPQRTWILSNMQEPGSVSKRVPPWALGEGYRNGSAFAMAIRTRFVTRPNSWLAQRFEKAASELQLPHPIVSVHVRHGDKAVEMVLKGFEEYMVHVRKLNVKDVFIGTEDPQVIKEAKVYEETEGFRFHYISEHLLNASPEVQSRKLGPTTLGIMCLKNVFYASQSDYWVGTLQSNFCQLINELRVRNGHPYIDLHNMDPDHSHW